VRGRLWRHTCLRHARIATVLILIGDFRKAFVRSLASEGVCRAKLRRVFLDTNIKVIKKSEPNKILMKFVTNFFLVL
jgi:hypothetical protein